ncbi:MAG: hypothetical protein ABDH37_02405 [Candidatus Hydrothermales bacterium]
MKILEEIKREIQESYKSFLKNHVTLPEDENEESEKEEFLIFEEGKSSFSFEIETGKEKKEEIEDILNLLKIGQYDKAIEKIRELKSKETPKILTDDLRISRDEINL